MTTTQLPTALLTQRTTKVVVFPIDHYTGSRHTRRAWGAGLSPKTAGPEAPASVTCDHHHKSIDAAKACGVALFKGLPANEGPRRCATSPFDEDPAGAARDTTQLKDLAAIEESK